MLDAPAPILLAVFAALLTELAFYFSLASPRLREEIPTGWHVAGALGGYLIYAVPTHVFQPVPFATLAVIALTLAFWYRVLPAHALSDAGFLLLAGTLVLAKVFKGIYARPHPDVAVEILGQLMWIRLGILTLLRDRKQEGVGFGFWPTRAEWRTGLLLYLAFLPVAFALAVATGFAAPALPAGPWWRTAGIALGTFAGIFWVVALGEEFYFRGVLQQWLERGTGSFPAALILTSLLFGSVHLGFRQFPNWRFAIVAAASGLFYGYAFRRARSIRAAMVTHALTVVTWRVFFR
jgi:membrane protease YdiL (CAAX protease family)